MADQKQIIGRVPDKKANAIMHKEYLTLLSRRQNKRKRDLLIDFGTNKDILAVAEIVYNLLEGTIPLNVKQRRTLRHYQNTLRQIARKSCSCKQKREILKQDGGFLPTLIPIALSVLSSLL